MAGFIGRANMEVSKAKRNGSMLIVLEPLPRNSLQAVASGVSTFSDEELRSTCKYGWHKKSETESDYVITPRHFLEILPRWWLLKGLLSHCTCSIMFKPSYHWLSYPPPLLHFSQPCLAPSHPPTSTLTHKLIIPDKWQDLASPFSYSGGDFVSYRRSLGSKFLSALNTQTNCCEVYRLNKLKGNGLWL